MDEFGNNPPPPNPPPKVFKHKEKTPSYSNFYKIDF
jgi:hypothetical protein